MIKLTNEELYKIEGSGGFGLAALIGAGIVFVIGLIDGIVHPKKC